MGGGLLQLVAYGAQDVYLTGNPQITFFKVVYRRHTNFAIEAIQQTFNGNAGYGNTVTCQISRNGDLINRMYLQVDVPKKKTAQAATNSTYQNYLGLRLIKSVVIEIGGQQIDKHYSDWLYIWNELSLPMGKRYAYDTMVGADKDILNGGYVNSDITNTTLYIPFEFWFCRNVGLALPLIALQYHEVKVKIDFETKPNCISVGTGALTDFEDIKNISLWADYIFLDTDERRRFAQLSHEYLIEQLQFTGTEPLVAGTNRIKLNFNHPCKELIWVAKVAPSSTTVNKTRWYDYTNLDVADDNTSESLAYGNDSALGGQYTSNYLVISDVKPKTNSNPFTNAILQLNGNDRFAVREGDYFNYVQPFQHHTNVPVNNSINVYSFALKPEDHQPSGTLNMSRIDTATLMVTAKSAPTNQSYQGINIYAVNYNVLRILSGMGGLAYSN
uniref:Major capsid protein N-terminal domain-containing protein n=1 Tax=viral metagenome TaxID=1070528 RepID=A0A6C0LBV3_9ZZZZ